MTQIPTPLPLHVVVRVATQIANNNKTFATMANTTPKRNIGTTKDDDTHLPKTPRECMAVARRTWLTACDKKDLQNVKKMYLRALTLSKTMEKPTTNASSVQKRKRRKTQSLSLTKDETKQVLEKIALLFIQSSKSDKAKKLLHDLGYVCRLSRSVLDYPLPNASRPSSASLLSNGSMIRSKYASKTPPCIIFDNFLNDHEDRTLRNIFQDPTASYWKDHDYEIEPPSPYFSYIIPAQSLSSKKYGFVGHIVNKILHTKQLREKFKELKRTRFIEMWAHNRPHASGHQMHFDSDDEGNGGVRNPIVSVILYLSDDTSGGGPSLVTTQALDDSTLADRGFLSHPKQRRLVAFDGRVLHGVVPGKGVREGRRVTLMFAFWEDVEVRKGEGHGSARAFPLSNESKQWAQDLIAPIVHCTRKGNGSLEVSDPIELDCVYETLDGRRWMRSMGMPEYDQVYQGF